MTTAGAASTFLSAFEWPCRDEHRHGRRAWRGRAGRQRQGSATTVQTADNGSGTVACSGADSHLGEGGLVKGLHTCLPLLVLAVAALPAPAAAASGGGHDDGGKALKKIRHFVVIYQENHSFDNLYGG